VFIAAIFHSVCGVYFLGFFLNPVYSTDGNVALKFSNINKEKIVIQIYWEKIY